MKSAIRMTYACLGAVLATGCMQARIEESREMKPPLPGRTGRHPGKAANRRGRRRRFMDCISTASASETVSRSMTTTNSSTRCSWFEPSTAPGKPEAMAALLARPGVAEKVTESGVRYVVWLDGNTRKTDGGGSLACGAAPGGAGCIGFGWWQKESAYEATIWDLKQGKSAGSVGTNVTGTSAIVGAVVPLPFIARVQATACNRMSNQLRSFFSGTDGQPAGTH